MLFLYFVTICALKDALNFAANLFIKLVKKKCYVCLRLTTLCVTVNDSVSVVASTASYNALTVTLARCRGNLSHLSMIKQKSVKIPIPIH